MTNHKDNREQMCVCRDIDIPHKHLDGKIRIPFISQENKYNSWEKLREEFGEYLRNNWEDRENLDVTSWWLEKLSLAIATEQQRIVGLVKGSIKYTLKEVAEMNKHLDSRTFQSSIDKSQGMIEHNEIILDLITQKK